MPRVFFKKSAQFIIHISSPTLTFTARVKQMGSIVELDKAKRKWEKDLGNFEILCV